jgi:hypothetical protein
MRDGFQLMIAGLAAYGTIILGIGIWLTFVR